VQEIERRFRERIAAARKTPPPSVSADPFEGLLELECNAWIRLRLEQERIAAQRDADDGTPEILKDWRRL
jgi:hypothetical protein